MQNIFSLMKDGTDFSLPNKFKFYHVTHVVQKLMAIKFKYKLVIINSISIRINVSKRL